MVKKGKKGEARFLHWLFLVIVIALLAFGSRGYQIYKINSQLEAAKTVRDTLLTENRALTVTAASLQEAQSIEQLARENLNMIYPGEKHFLISKLQKDVLPYQSMDGEILD